MAEEEGLVSRTTAVVASTAMAVLYVAILYSPTLILRLPPTTSLNSFMIRRFVCALISSLLSALLCARLLPAESSIFGAYGIRLDHLWQAIVFPLVLTSLLYAGSFISKFLFLVAAWRENKFQLLTLQEVFDKIQSTVVNVMAWRNYVVAPFTEEFVFRACMIPLLLCGGFKTSSIIFLSPISFSLAHLNHFLELYCQQRYTFLRAAMIVGLQLGYTVVFGVYASFLFIRTGNLLAPIVAHIFCNIMGLPVFLSSHGKGATIMASIVGCLAFLKLLFPASNPELYNSRANHCSCWHGPCRWY